MHARGKYVVKETLRLYKVLGGTIIGHGETTVLIWQGKKGGNSTMILSDGISRSRMIGFVLDGSAGCDVGVEHHSNASLFETRIRHQNQKFLNFGSAGIRIGDGGNMPGRKESAEIIYENCIFDSCGTGCTGLPYAPMTSAGCGGLAILNFNDYDNVVDGCHFSRNSFGIYNVRWLLCVPPPSSRALTRRILRGRTRWPMCTCGTPASKPASMPTCTWPPRLATPSAVPSPPARRSSSLQ